MPHWVQLTALLLVVLQFCAQVTRNRTITAIVGGPSAGTTNYSYNSLNQLTGYSDNTGRTVTLGYDNNGNRTSRVVTAGSDNGTDSYTYDFENRLVGLVKGTGGGGTGTYAYQYDYRTRRIVRDESNAGGAITNLVFSGGTSVQEYDGTTSPTLTVEYIRGSDYGGGVGGILYTLRNDTPSYTHENRRGDVVAKTDGSGNLTYQAQYEAFGKQVATTGSTLDRQKSNSKDTDPTNLVDEGFRYRDLETGMFLNRDPAGFVDGPNLYTYVVQNPWTKFDPEGLTLADVPGAVVDTLHGIGEGFVGAGQALGNNIVTSGEAVFNGQLSGAVSNIYNAPSGSISNAIKQDVSAAATQFAENARTPEGQGKNLGAAITLLVGGAKASEDTAGGRLGNSTTRQQVSDVADTMEGRGWDIKNGGDRESGEEYIPGPKGAKKGSAYPDITATKDGRTLRVNTVDTKADGVTPTTREADNAAKIRSLKPDDHLLLIPKAKAPPAPTVTARQAAGPAAAAQANSPPSKPQNN